MNVQIKMEIVLQSSVLVLFVLVKAPQSCPLNEHLEKPEVINEDQSAFPDWVRSHHQQDLPSVIEASRIVKILSVTNGGPFGDWGIVWLCADGSYAVGYDMKIEPEQESGDDTALNGIQLICGFLDGEYAGEATSAVGPWGRWVGGIKCNSSRYLTAFDLQVEEFQEFGDDTAANYVKFKCQDLCRRRQSMELVKPPGHGLWGIWGSWSAECPKQTAICGIQTKVETPGGDDTSLNDVRFFCCR